nr:RNA-binding protein 14-like [Anolis sagrei ordinatus]
MPRPNPSGSVRLFVQNVPRGTSEEALRRHFEGATRPADVLDMILRNTCATVRMRDEAAGERARRDLHRRPFRGLRLSVQRFRAIKIYVGGLPEACAAEDLLPLFKEFGPVAECVVVKDYGFVHMENEEDGKAAIAQLNGTELKGRRITVKRSVNDRNPKVRKQNSGQQTEFQGDIFLDPYYGDEPPESFDHDYRPQATAYRNGAESDPYSYMEASRGRPHSAQSRSYGSKPYDSHSAVYENQDAYDMQDDMPASYSPQFFDSMSAHDRASVDVAYRSPPDRLASAYRVQSPRSGLPRSPQRATSSFGELWPETTSRHSLYERVRLSPPSTSYKEHYKDEYAVDKRRMVKEMDDRYGPPYEYVRFSPPRRSGDNFDRRGNEPSKRYTARSGSASHYPEGSGSASRYPEGSGSASRYPEGSGSASRYTEGSGSASRYTEGSGSASRYIEGSGNASRYTERSGSARYTEGSGSASHYTERSGSARYPERSGSARYTERPGSAPRHRPYERICLSPPRRSRENHRSYH